MKEIQMKNNKRRTAIIIILVIGLLLAIISSFFIWLKIYDDVFFNIYVSGNKVSGMSKQELTSFISSMNISESVNVLYSNEKVTNINTEEIDFKIDVEATVLNIMSEGRSGNIFVNAYTVISNLFKAKNIEPVIKYSDEKLEQLICKIGSNVDGMVMDDTYYLQDGQTLVISIGKNGLDYDKSRVKQEILSLLSNGKQDTEYVLNMYYREAKALDIDEVYNEVYKVAKDAFEYIVENGNKVYEPHEYGVTFDKGELAQVILNHKQSDLTENIIYELTVVEPEVKLGDLKSWMYADLLGTFSTTFSMANVNRATNIKVATQYIDGTIIQPGEVFSFNNTVGDCGSAERGFKPASIYVVGGTALGMGGGVCQVSTTIYNALLYAGFDTVLRYNHAFTVSYVQPSRDAMISYPDLDLKMKNVREYPVKISAIFSDSGRVTFSIYGTKEDMEYDVEIQSNVKSTWGFPTNYQNDSTMLKGQQEILQYGQGGCRSEAYKILKKNGIEISRKLLSDDYYYAMPQTVRVGTKEEVKPYGG